MQTSEFNVSQFIQLHSSLDRTQLLLWLLMSTLPNELLLNIFYVHNYVCVQEKMVFHCLKR